MKISKISQLRVLAIFLVVLGHSIIIYSSEWFLYETIKNVYILDVLKKIIDVVQMPLFFSLSGYLFVFSHKKYSSTQLLVKKTKRLIVPYLIVGVFYMMPIRLIIGYEGYNNKGFGELLLNFLISTDVGHLWFLPALFFCFLLSKCILSLIEKLPYVCKDTAIWFFVLSCILYFRGHLIGIKYSPILHAINYLIWFSLGYLINVKSVLITKLYKHCLLKMCFLGFGITSIVLSLVNTHWIWSFVAKWMFILNMYGIDVNIQNNVIKNVDFNSFGIYLFHSPLIYITFSTIPNANPFLVVFINLVVLGYMAYLLTAVIKRTKFKFIIGE